MWKPLFLKKWARIIRSWKQSKVIEMIIRHDYGISDCGWRVHPSQCKIDSSSSLHISFSFCLFGGCHGDKALFAGSVSDRDMRQQQNIFYYAWVHSFVRQKIAFKAEY